MKNHTAMRRVIAGVAAAAAFAVVPAGVAGAQPIRVDPTSGGASCYYNGWEYASGSTIVHIGTTYICRDGQWVAQNWRPISR